MERRCIRQMGTNQLTGMVCEQGLNLAITTCLNLVPFKSYYTVSNIYCCFTLRTHVLVHKSLWTEASSKCPKCKCKHVNMTWDLILSHSSSCPSVRGGRTCSSPPQTTGRCISHRCTSGPGEKGAKASKPEARSVCLNAWLPWEIRGSVSAPVVCRLT